MCDTADCQARYLTGLHRVQSYYKVLPCCKVTKLPPSQPIWSSNLQHEQVPPTGRGKMPEAPPLRGILRRNWRKYKIQK
ncbi:hypothetical protein E2C01_042980 [Portunus trituberculatus]|uniref:Uncharacterized protein n=1 Tax=Portunus trituberculatus TaxID=210409 RepID=A0A5B7FV17_PORTR|nr:hypothetical protein [Portunus trituberculatus]